MPWRNAARLRASDILISPVKTTAFPLLLAGLLTSVACSLNPIDDLSAVLGTDSDVVARINGQVLSGKDFESYVGFVQGELSDDPTPAPRKELFQEFLTNQLLLQEAKRKGVTVGEEELKQLAVTWGPKDAPIENSFPDYLYQYLVVQKLLRQEALKSVSVTAQEIQNYFAAHSEEFRSGDQARVLEILTPTREEAVELRERLKDGDVNSFKEAARLHSLGVTAESGGDLGIFHRGELPEEFDRVVFRLRPGEISEPFQSSSGFHLFALEEWISDHPKRLYEVQEEIFEILTARKEREAVDKYVAGLVKNARIEITDPSLALP